MTRKINKLVAVDANPSSNLDISIEDNPEENLTLEQIVADELLDSIDWKAVNKALLNGLQRKFIRWFVSGSASTIATNEIEAQAIASGELIFDDEVAA